MDIKANQVNKVFAAWDKPDTPGCAIAVMKDNNIIFKGGYGIANLEYEIPITPTTIFHIASVSKQFTAMAIALLADDGKILLDDDIRKHVPEVPDFGETISIRHIIHHTSGLRDQWDLLVLAGWRMDDVITTADVLGLVERQKELSFKPGDEHLYSNTGYTLLAIIVERISRKTFGQFCAERIFKPLGMQNTHFHEDHTQIVKNRAYSYTPKGDGFQHAVLSYAIAGATSLFSTVEDLALWEQNFYDAAVGGTAVIQQMHHQGVLNNGEQINYAFGLASGMYKGLNFISHSGGDAGYKSYLMRIPTHQFSVAILGNLSTMNPPELAKRVADIYLEDAFEEEVEQAIDKSPVIALSAAQLASKAGIYYNADREITYYLEMRDNKLTLVIGPGFVLEPLSEELFQEAAYPQIKYKFATTEHGVCQFETSDGYGKPDTYVAVDSANPSVEEMNDYVGTYYSPELDVRYTVILKDEKLILKRRKYGESSLLPTFRDGFIGDYMTEEGSGGLYIKFTRDEKGRLDGISLSTGRVRGLLFMKQ
ncbi:MAG: serine hydrolase domain-containing protein [Chloroflexota bacterium]